MIMFSNLATTLSFNEVEYFIFSNLWLLSIFLLLLSYFILLNSCLLYFSSVYFNHSFIELCVSLLCVILLLFIISPCLIILLDYDLIFIPSFIIYIVGYQWAWNYSIYFWSTYNCYIDQYIISINNSQYNSTCFDDRLIKYFNSSVKPIILNMIYSRLILNNSSIVLPLFSVIKILVLSFDVIHSIGYYSLGIKIDSIPARINTAQSIRPLFKGQYRGFCFESCGQGHASMISTLQLQFNIFNNYWIYSSLSIIHYTFHLVY